MNASGLSKEHERELWQGRLMLALVSARARQCPNRKCARKRHCLAGHGKDTSIYSKKGGCPVMSEEEWALISLGVQRNMLGIIKPFLRAVEDEEEAAKPKISWEEKKRRYWTPEEVEKRAAAERERKALPGLSYHQMLWLRPRGKEAVWPIDFPARGERLVKGMAEAGCRCAKERKLVCLEERGAFGSLEPAECV